MTDRRENSPRRAEFTAALDDAEEGRLVIAGGRPELAITGERELRDLARINTVGREPLVTSARGVVQLRYARAGVIEWLREIARPPRATAALGLRVPWALEFPDGVYRLRAKLEDLVVTRIEVRGGINRAELWLPWPTATVAVTVIGGASGLHLHRPAGTPFRLSVSGGISSLAIDGDRSGALGRSIRHETPGWAAAPDRLDVSIRGGVSSLELC